MLALGCAHRLVNIPEERYSNEPSNPGRTEYSRTTPSMRDTTSVRAFASCLRRPPLGRSLLALRGYANAPGFNARTRPILAGAAYRDVKGTGKRARPGNARDYRGTTRGHVRHGTDPVPARPAAM